jgi:pre-mRNA-splicing factor SPF27
VSYVSETGRVGHRQRIQEVNWERKSEQTTEGAELFKLESRWGELVSNNVAIESACQQLEKEIEKLKEDLN